MHVPTGLHLRSLWVLKIQEDFSDCCHQQLISALAANCYESLQASSLASDDTREIPDAPGTGVEPVYRPNHILFPWRC